MDSAHDHVSLLLMVVVPSPGSGDLVDVLRSSDAEVVIEAAAVYTEVDVVALVHGPMPVIGELITKIVNDDTTEAIAPYRLRVIKFAPKYKERCDSANLRAVVRITLMHGSVRTKETIFDQITSGELFKSVLWAGLMESRNEIALEVEVRDVHDLHRIVMDNLQQRFRQISSTRTYVVINDISARYHFAQEPPRCMSDERVQGGRRGSYTVVENGVSRDATWVEIDEIRKSSPERRFGFFGDGEGKGRLFIGGRSVKMRPQAFPLANAAFARFNEVLLAEADLAASVWGPQASTKGSGLRNIIKVFNDTLAGYANLQPAGAGFRRLVVTGDFSWICPPGFTDPG